MIFSLTQSLRRSLRMTSLAWYIARHYLFSRERQALEWIVTLISIAGVAVGVGTIISTFGVIDGMKDHVIGQIVAGHANLSIHNQTWRKENPDPKVIAQVRALSLKPAGIDSIYVMLRDPMTALEVKAKLLKVLPQGTTINTWIEQFEEMFSDMKIIKCGMALVMLMTMVVAALNIIGTLTLIVIQKTREIGILKAMGAPRQLVGRIFLAEGALVGVVGSVIGIAMGFGFCWVIKAWKIPMPGNLFRFREIPAQFSLTIALLTALVSILICTIAALAPAWRAGGLNPVEALRHE